MAAVGTGMWSNFRKIDSIHKVENVAKPVAENQAVYEKLLPVFIQAGKSQSELGDMLSGIEI